MQASVGPSGAPGPTTLSAPGHRVSPRARWFWAARAALPWAGFLLAQAVWWLAAGRPAWVHVVVGAVSLVLAAAHLAVMPQVRYRLHRWEATPAAVHTQQGWLVVERRIAPVSRVQTVDTERGPLEQLFGLTTVTITTASAAGAVRIEGLDRGTAARLVDAVTAVTAADPGDAT